jgi:uncharacterized Tic20 family protein
MPFSKEKAMQPQPTHEERTLAALAHASIVANGMGLVGILAAALIWATQRERSAYVRAHAMQALAYQGAAILVGLILTLSWGACLAVSLLPLALRPELYTDRTLPAPFWLALSSVIVPIGFGILATLYGIVGALQAYRNRSFHYPLFGRLAREEIGSAARIAAATPAPADTALPAAPAQPTEPAEPARAESAAGDHTGAGEP